MKVFVVGTGYVGLVTGSCLADLIKVNDVVCIDKDERKIDSLRNGIVTIHEENLEEILASAIGKRRIHFELSLVDAVSKYGYPDIVMCCVGTPQNADGTPNLEYVKSVACEFAEILSNDVPRPIFVMKSTVPPGTGNMIKQTILDHTISKNGSPIDFGYVSEPEFFAEGTAIYNFFNRDRIVLGSDDEKDVDTIEGLYSDLDVIDVVRTTIPSAEMIKYASNAMLATKISFINEIANLCEKVGADVYDVRAGMSLDPRIGRSFLRAGCGYGGSCFPKDVRGLISLGDEFGVDMKLAKAVDDVNNRQKKVLFTKLNDAFNGDFKDKIITIFGAAFKPGTDDLRESPALVLIESLENTDCKEIRVVDTHATVKETEKTKNYCDLKSAVEGSDAIVITSDDPSFSNENANYFDFALNMRTKLIIDGRNLLDKIVKFYGFEYYGIGR